MQLGGGARSSACAVEQEAWEEGEQGKLWAARWVRVKRRPMG